MLIARDRLIFVVRKRKLAQEGIRCKLELLDMLWNRELNAMSMVAIKSKDKKHRALVGDLKMIKDDVKLSLLKAYLYLCSIRHSLAFFQWREANSSRTDVSLVP